MKPATATADHERNSCSCGETREARVICPAGHNCTTAAASSVPWQAAIVKRNHWQPYCGGSLINDRDGGTADQSLYPGTYCTYRVVQLVG